MKPPSSCADVRAAEEEGGWGMEVPRARLSGRRNLPTPALPSSPAQASGQEGREPKPPSSCADVRAAEEEGGWGMEVPPSETLRQAKPPHPSPPLLRRANIQHKREGSKGHGTWSRRCLHPAKGWSYNRYAPADQPIWQTCDAAAPREPRCLRRARSCWRARAPASRPCCPRPASEGFRAAHRSQR